MGGLIPTIKRPPCIAQYPKVPCPCPPFLFLPPTWDLMPHRLQHRHLGTQAEVGLGVPSQALGAGVPPKVPSSCRGPMDTRGVSAPRGAVGLFQQFLVCWGGCTCERVFCALPSHRAFYHSPGRPHVSGGAQQQALERRIDLWARLLSCSCEGCLLELPIPRSPPNLNEMPFPLLHPTHPLCHVQDSCRSKSWHKCFFWGKHHPKQVLRCPPPSALHSQSAEAMEGRGQSAWNAVQRRNTSLKVK